MGSPINRPTAQEDAITLPWYKVNHPWFDADTAYRAVWYSLPSESAWAYLTFILPTHHTVAVQVWRCTALPVTCEQRHLDHSGYSRPMTETEKLIEWARKPRAANPDLDLDMQ